MSSSHLYFQLHSTAETFIQSYDQERCRADIASLSLSLTQDCKRYIGPASVGVPSLSSPISNTDYEATESRIFDAAATRSMTMRDITVDEVQRKAVVHVMHSISMKPAYGQGTYDLETMFTLWMTADGNKINKVTEFADSLATTRFSEEQSGVSPTREEHGDG